MKPIGLPNFLIIGAQKSGTTWLYNVLKSHPKIKMAVDRKEVHFFDRYYDRGIEWYKNKFPTNFNGLIGEVTPAYLYEEKCPLRIKKTLSEVKLICILRNPIDRAYSQYKYLVQEKNCSQNFEQIIKDNSDLLARGLYYQQLSRYYNYFTKENIKVVIFEQVMSNKQEKIREICDFLNISYQFDTNKLYEKSNTSQIPRFKFLYSLAKKLARKLYDSDLVFIINLMKKMGLKDLFFSDKSEQEFPPLSAEIRLELKGCYQNDINKLETLIDQEVTKIWNSNY